MQWEEHTAIHTLLQIYEVVAIQRLSVLLLCLWRKILLNNNSIAEK